MSQDRALAAWRAALSAAKPVGRVGGLYQGGYWSVVRDTCATVTTSLRCAVVSAGLGTREFDDYVPAYSATFTPGQVDTVPGGGNAQGRLAWWRGLDGDTRLRNSIEQSAPEAVVVAVSAAYLDVIAPILIDIQHMVGADRLIVLGGQKARSAGRFGASWVGVPLTALRHLGGTAGQLTCRAARLLLEAADDGLTASAARELLAQVAPADAEAFYPKRLRRTPDQVRSWLVGPLSEPYPPGSASAALRRLRDEGFAFERKRFHALYHEVVSRQGSLP